MTDDNLHAVIEGNTVDGYSVRLYDGQRALPNLIHRTQRFETAEGVARRELELERQRRSSHVKVDIQ